MSRPPFRFAVQATNAPARANGATLARKVEDLGYSTLFLADHYLGPGPAQRAARTPRQDLAPIAAMARRRRHRHAAHRLPGVLHRLPRARRAGEGGGDARPALRRPPRIRHRRRVERRGIRAMGLSFDPPRSRIKKLERSSRWSRPTSPATSSTAPASSSTSAGTPGTASPVQRPRPPIMIGGGGQRVLVARRTRGRHRQHRQRPVRRRQRAGLTPQNEARTTLGLRPCGGTASAFGRRWTSRARPTSRRSPTTRRGRSRSVRDGVRRARRVLLDHPNVLIGSVAAVVETLQQRREALGVNYVTVQQSRIDAFAPVVARLRGL